MTVTRVGVVGGGTMGQGIATTCASAGLQVFIEDRSPELAIRARTAISEQIDRDIAKWRYTEAEKKAILERLHPVESLSGLRNVQVVIEAVPEDLELKCSLFAELDRLCNAECILATNTASLSVSQIGSHTQHPGRVIGLHFLHPAPWVPLVEIVRGLATSDATFSAAREFVLSIRKTGVEVFEYPGYISTRVILPFLNEAMHVVMEGVASAEAVDTAMKLGYGLSVGPLTLADRMGLDEVMRWMQYLFNELGDLKYRPCPLLRKMVRAGHLGVKTGQGFFKYDETERVHPAEETR
jgi:3-hydroxybutyryl-CoA dehydrogenase